MENYFQILINFIYPSRCIFCDKVFEVTENKKICDTCNNTIDYFNSDYINTKTLSFTNCYKTIAVFKYEGKVKEALLDYKFNHKFYLYAGFGFKLIEKINKIKDDFKFDLVVSVPLSDDSIRVRGYNQSYLISKLVSKAFSVPEFSKYIKKIKNIKAQSLLKKDERAQNIKNVFQVKNKLKFTGKSVLIVDDIVTTGSTVDELASELLDCGAKYIVVAVIAVAIKQY